MFHTLHSLVSLDAGPSDLVNIKMTSHAWEDLAMALHAVFRIAISVVVLKTDEDVENTLPQRTE